MLLTEITSRVDVKVIVEIVKAIEDFTGNDHHVQANAIQVLQKYYNHPSVKPFLYEGPMFRALYKEGNDNEFSEREIMQQLNSRSLFSFAKTRDGVDAYLDVAFSRYDEPYTITIFKQIGRGYDTQKLFRYVRQFSQDDLKQAGISPQLFNLGRAGGTFPGTNYQFGTVREVLAPIGKNLKVIDVENLYADEDEYDE